MAFTSMSTATTDDLNAYLDHYRQDAMDLPGRLIDMLLALDDTAPGVAVTRFEHSLQSASRAYRDGQDEEYVVAALLHDIGDNLAPYSHGEFCGAIFRPYLPERICWIVEKHPIFQLFHYAHKVGLDRNGRDAYRDHPWYRDTVEFCAKYDQNCFDPEYESIPLEFFLPMVQRVFSEPRYSQGELSPVAEA